MSNNKKSIQKKDKISDNRSIEETVIALISRNTQILKPLNKNAEVVFRHAICANVRSEIRDAVFKKKLTIKEAGRQATKILEKDNVLLSKGWFDNIMYHRRLPNHEEVKALAQVLDIEESYIDVHLRLAPWTMEMQNIYAKTIEQNKVTDVETSEHRYEDSFLVSEPVENLSTIHFPDAPMEPYPMPLPTPRSEMTEPLKPWLSLDEIGRPKPEMTESKPNDFTFPDFGTPDSKLESSEEFALEPASEPAFITSLISDFLKQKPEKNSLRRRAYDMQTAALILELLADRQDEWEEYD